MAFLFTPGACLLAIAVCALAAEDAPSPPAVQTEAPQQSSSLQQLKEEFDRDDAALDEEQKTGAAALAREYADQLDALARQLMNERRPLLAVAARAEKARVEAGVEIVEESAPREPFEVLRARGVYREKLRALESDCLGKFIKRAERFWAALEAVAASGGPDAADAKSLLEPERGGHPWNDRSAVRLVPQRTRAAGGEGGGAFEDVATDGAFLSGMVLHTGDFAGHTVLVAVQPIFRSPTSTRFGKRHGVPRGGAVTIDAKQGYAIGGLNLHSGDRVDGLEIVFMKIKADRVGLDPADSYRSSWVGGKGGGPVQIGGEGNPIVGVFGASGAELDSLGLVEQRREAAPGPAAGNTPVKEVTRENPGAVSVAGLSAEALAESADSAGGKWQRVPEALRGARIFSVTPDKHLGVAEYKVTTPGRVYLACSYDYQGNRSGEWTEERWMPEDFVKHGWTRVEGVELRSWDGRSFLIFTRDVKSGESGRLRCNKYEPPYFITFAP